MCKEQPLRARYSRCCQEVRSLHTLCNCILYCNTQLCTEEVLMIVSSLLPQFFSCFRCFLCAGSPASLPSKSWVAEAICIKLCKNIIQPHRERCYGQQERYTSRWKLILREYNCVKAHLLNSVALLEGTDLVLFPINKTTLVRWYKNITRTNEMKLLLQGHSLPRSQLSCASDSFPPAQSQLSR